jgi:hypothetical protein
VVFRTASGSKLTAAQEQQRVAFEADSCNLQTRTGWGVLLTGRATASARSVPRCRRAS